MSEIETQNDNLTVTLHSALKDAIARLRGLEQTINDTEEQLKQYKADLRTLSEVTIPDLLNELGVSKLTLDTGESVSTKMDVAVQIPADRKAEAYAWLDQHGLGDVIKTTVTLAYTRDHRADAVDMAERLQGTEGASVAIGETVHPMTLKSTIKELLANGQDVPLDTFGAREYYKTVIRDPN